MAGLIFCDAATSKDTTGSSVARTGIAHVFTITERILSDVPRRKAVRVLLVTYESIR